jgi:hypothetical protein
MKAAALVLLLTLQTASPALAYTCPVPASDRLSPEFIDLTDILDQRRGDYCIG